LPWGDGVVEGWRGDACLTNQEIRTKTEALKSFELSGAWIWRNLTTHFVISVAICILNQVADKLQQARLISASKWIAVRPVVPHIGEAKP
jgi:hypothetical protein